MQGKQSLRESALRAITWAAIFTGVAVFWGGVVAALVAWMW